MITPRRTFSGTAFVGIILKSSGTQDAKLIFDSQQYIGRDGIFNVWSLRFNSSRNKNEWFLCCGDNGMPLEFSSKKDVEDYIKQHGLELYNHNHRDNPYPGLSRIRPVPTELHPSNFMFFNSQEWNLFLYKVNSEVTIPNGLMSHFQEMFSQDNCGEQAVIWLEILCNKHLKSLVMAFLKSPTFCEWLQNIFCGNSYHSNLARLEVFYPANPE